MEYYKDRCSGTTFKPAFARQGPLFKDALRPIDSFSSLEGVQIGTTPFLDDCESSSRRLYAVNGWGHPYFLIEDSGRLCIKPTGGLIPVSRSCTSFKLYKPNGTIDVLVPMPINRSARQGSPCSMSSRDHVLPSWQCIFAISRLLMSTTAQNVRFKLAGPSSQLCYLRETGNVQRVLYQLTCMSYAAKHSSRAYNFQCCFDSQRLSEGGFMRSRWGLLADFILHVYVLFRQ